MLRNLKTYICMTGFAIIVKILITTLEQIVLCVKDQRNLMI